MAEDDPNKSGWGGDYASGRGPYRTRGTDASDLYGNPIKGAKQAPKSREDLSESEDNGGEPAATEGGFYRAGASQRGTRESRSRGPTPGRGGNNTNKGNRSWLSKHRKEVLLFGGGSAVLIIPLIMFLAVLVPSLKLPQFAAEIESYRLARISRTFYRNASLLTSDKAALDTTADATTKELVGKTPLGSALALYRPDRVINNMKATNVLNFEYDSKSRLQSLVLNGEKIPVPNYKYSLKPGDLIDNYKQRIEFAAKIKANLNYALDGSNFLVRTAVAKRLLSGVGINLLWWEKAGSSFRGKTQAEADRLATQQAAQKIDTPATELPPAKTDQVKNAIQDAEQAKAECLRDPNCTDWLARYNGLPPQITKVIEKDTTISSTSQILGVLNPIYAAAFPVCLVYDGSATLSQDFAKYINAQNAEVLKSFFAVATADSQFKNGGVAAEALGAFNRKLGNIGTSYVNQVLRGQKVDTSADVSPQAGRMGEFTAFDALFGAGAFAGAANAIADTACPVATNTWVGAGTALANILLLLIPGLDIGVAENDAADVAVEEASQSIVSQITNKIISQFTTSAGRAAIKNTAKKYTVSTIKTASATSALTYAMRMIVLADMGQFFSGTDNSNFDNNADKGAVAYNNTMMQQSTYGRPLTQSETSGVEKADLGYAQQQNQNQSTFTRYFALSNPYSPAGKLAMDASNLNMNSVASFFGSLPHMFASIFKPFGFMFGHAAAAAPTNADYGMVQFGWSTAEEKLINNDPTYDPAINAQILANSGQADAIAAKYGQCFTDDIGTMLTNKINGEPELQRNDKGQVVGGVCSGENLSFDSQDTSFGTDSSSPDHPNDLVFRWRLNQSYQTTLGDLTDTQNATGSVGADQVGNNASLVWPFSTKDTSQYRRVDQGWDIQANAGAQIYAIASGTIEQKNPDVGCGFGNDYPVEVLDNSIGGPSNWIYYGHVHVVPGVVGKHVNAGQLIATANTSDGSSNCGATQNGSAAPEGWLEIGFAQPNTDAPVDKGGEDAATPSGQKMHDILINAPVAGAK